MWCAIVRWLISRAEDTGRARPRWAERHAGRCPACGAFARTSAALASRLRSERAAWLDGVPELRGRRAPGLDAAGDAGTGVTGRERPRPSRPWLRPLPVAASLLLVVAAGWVVLRVTRPEPRTTVSEAAAARAAFERLASAPKGLRGALAEAGSPLERERRTLEGLVASAADYLGDRLNVRIERKGDSKGR